MWPSQASSVILTQAGSFGNLDCEQLDFIQQKIKGKHIHPFSMVYQEGPWTAILYPIWLLNLKGCLKQQKPLPPLAININSLLQSFHFPSCCSRKIWIKKPGSAQGQLIALRWQKILEQLTKWPWEGTGPWLKVTVGSVCPMQHVLYAWSMKRFSSPRIMQLKSTPPEPILCQLVQNWAWDPGAELKFEAYTSRSAGREGRVWVCFLVQTGAGYQDGGTCVYCPW